MNDLPLFRDLPADDTPADADDDDRLARVYIVTTSGRGSKNVFITTVRDAKKICSLPETCVKNGSRSWMYMWTAHDIPMTLKEARAQNRGKLQADDGRFAKLFAQNGIEIIKSYSLAE